MKNLFFILFFISACGSPKMIPNDEPETSNLTYNIQPNLTDETPNVHVNFKAISDEKGELHLSYPNDDWGEKNLFNSVKEFEVSPKADHQFLKGKNEILIKGDPKKTYTISYTVFQDFTEKLTSDKAYRPIVNKNYFHLFGKNLFMMPHTLFPENGVPIEVKINWGNASGDYDVINSFGSEKSQKINVSNEELYSSVFMGGQLNSFEKLWGTNNVVFSTPDTWENINIKKLQEDLYKIVVQQRKFWKDESSESTTVTLLKTYEDCVDDKDCHNSCSGTGLTNSFATFSSDNLLSSNERLNWLFAHELFHHWVGSTIVNESEETEYWFSEGFTDYYAYKLLLRNGMLSFEDFVEKINEEVIEPHYTSPVKSRANGDINAQTFWSGDKNWESLPYQRGFIYALYLDSKIKLTLDARSLDDLMLDILNWTKTNNLKFNRNVFLERLNNYKLPDFEQEFDNFIEEGNPIDLTVLKIKGVFFETGNVPFMRLKENLKPEEISRFFIR